MPYPPRPPASRPGRDIRLARGPLQAAAPQAAALLAALLLGACASRPTSGAEPSPAPAAGAPATSAPSSARPLPPEAVERFFDMVRAEYSGDRAKETVAYVEQRWRVPGNTGFDESIRYVEARLREAGYVREDSAPAGARLTYRVEHRPMSRDTWEPVDASVTIVGQDSALLRWATNRNMLTINSRSTPDGGVEAEVVDAGAGSPEELDRLDVRGKIVFATSPASRLHAEAVQKRGALGVLAYNMPAYLRPEVNRTSIQFSSIPVGSESWAILLSNAAREELRRALAAGPVRVRVSTEARSWRAEELTIVADVHGDRLPDERYVLSAHVQEPGANDNASGVGAQAELARVLAKLVREGRVSPARTITMLWGDEIKSTRDYLAADSARTAGVRWGMSLDMVGEDTERTGGTFLIEKMPDPSAVWTRGDDRHSEWGGRPLKVEDIRPHYFNDLVLARSLDQGAYANWVVRTNPFEGGSDHTPFLTAGKPGLLLWHFTDQFYHTDRDRIEMVSPRTLANVGTVALVTALELTTADGPVARSVVADVEHAAVERLAIEESLSRAAVAAGKPRAEEELLLRTWTDYYVKALHAVDDVQLGGSDAATRQAIAAAAERVAARGKAALAAIGG